MSLIAGKPLERIPTNEVKMERQTGNQQRKVTGIELGWLCGIIDGEGTVTLNTYVRGQQYKTIVPVVLIDNTHMPSLEVCSSILKRMGVGHFIQSPRLYFKKGQTFARPKWRITISGHKRVKYLLSQIDDYLVIKREQAREVLAFILLRETRNSHNSYGNEELTMLETIRTLNKGSRKPVKSFNDYTLTRT